MSVFFYISGHGFGHAARSVQVINALRRQEPDLQIELRTTVPRWFLEATLDRHVDVVPGETDTGLVQPDSLSIDEAASAAQTAEFYATFPMRVEAEAGLLRARAPSLVVGDVPPLAFAAALRAGIPSVALANFTWDWIYADYPEFHQHAAEALARIRDAYATATLALRLPFAGGFASMRRIEDVPLVARRATVDPRDTRARLGLASDRPLVLASFGGHGGGVRLARAARSTSFTLVATEYEAGPAPEDRDGVHVVSQADLRAAGVTYTDLLASCDVVTTKLGYGIVSECIANDVALLYTRRGRFIEQEIFEREMPEVLRCRYIDREALRAGDWAPAIGALLAQPPPPRAMRADGAETAAQRILNVEF